MKETDEPSFLAIFIYSHVQNIIHLIFVYVEIKHFRII